MPLDRARWKAAQRAELAEAKAHSDALSLGERTEEAIALYLMTVAEIASRANDRDELVALLSMQESSPPLHARWQSLHRR